MKAYYAHCMAIYNTPQESRDVALISGLGFEVVNPNNLEVENDMIRIKQDGTLTDDKFDYFRRFSKECDVICFRALPDGSIPSGVAKEIEYFQEENKPILELPSGISRRGINKEQTREYLREVGQR